MSCVRTLSLFSRKALNSARLQLLHSSEMYCNRRGIRVQHHQLAPPHWITPHVHVDTHAGDWAGLVGLASPSNPTPLDRSP